MFRGLPTASLPLVQLFASPYLFTVPAYQRPYCWTTKEAGQLFEDVTEAAAINGPGAGTPDYFLGAILLLDPEAEGPAPPPAFGGPRIYEVVDGQQRLVTLAILASTLRDFEDRDGALAEEGGKLADRLDQMVRIERHDRDITARWTRIRLSDSEQDCFEKDVLARLPRTSEAAPPWHEIKTVHEFIKSEVESLTREERRALARYLIEYCHVVVIITRDIDRAHTFFSVLNERGKPLERKDILKAEVVRGLAPAEMATGVLLWQRAHARLGPELEPFFGHLRLAYGNHRLPIIAGMRALVAEHGSLPFLETFVTPMVDALQRLRAFRDCPRIGRRPALFAALTCLERLGKSDWVPAALLAMSRFDADPATASALLIEIERLAFLLRLRGLGADKRQRRFNAIISAIKSNPATALASSEFEITRDEQRMIAHHLKDIHRRNAPIAKLLLMRIEDEMSFVPLAISPQDLSVEHVLPQRPSPSSAWRKLFPDNAERETCQASLGNLALVTPRQNDRAENKDFAQKLEIYREVEPGAPVFVSNAAILEARTWQAADIKNREAQMMDVIAKLWRLERLTLQGPGNPVDTPANGS